METDTKKPWQSKTLWANAILAACALILPGPGRFLQDHPETLTSIFAGVNIVLRLISKDKITLKD